MNLEEAFERHGDEFLKFDRIANPCHPRPDLCAFLVLHNLAPAAGDMVAGASHDAIFLDVDCEALAEVITDEQVRDLVRCGVRWDIDGLVMFV